MMSEIIAIWDDREAREWLTRLQRRIRDLTPFMRRIGERLMLSTSRRFEAGRDPEGRPWRAASDFAPSRQRGGTPLHGRGHLARPGRGYDYRARRDRVELGTRLRYGLIHQFGGRIRPKEAKALTLPFPGVTRTARSYADTFIRRGTIMQTRRRGKPRALFALKQQVTLPARPYLGVEEADWAAIRELFRLAVLEGR